MALFTDGSMASLSDLKQYESSILDVASTEGVDLTHKLELARREIGLELAAFLLRKGALPGSQRELTNVVVTEPLVHWHAVHTLALVYRDAFNSQLNDRYRGKWDEFARQAERAQALFQDIGVGMTMGPIPKAPVPVLGATPGGVLPASRYYVRIAWQSPTVSTGAWSDLVAEDVDPGMRLMVAVPQAPADIAGTVIYAGLSESELTRQNESLLTPGHVWTMPTTGLRTDLPRIAIQKPDYFVGKRQEMMRG